MGAFLALGAGNAFAFSCTSGNGDDANDVVLQFVNETVTLSKGPNSAILANGVPCGTATASNTETIYVAVSNAPAGPLANFILDEGGGRFEPGVNGTAGLSAEAVGSLNEIEIIFVDLDPLGAAGEQVLDSLTILGNSAADTINIGEGLAAQQADDGEATPVIGAVAAADADTDEVGVINLNGDDDADMYFFEDGDLDDVVEDPEPSITVRTRAGADFVTGKGGGGTGDQADQDLILDGGDGDDHLQGGDENDTLIGGAGNDTLDGDSDDLTSGTTAGPCSGDQDDGPSLNINPATGQASVAFIVGDTADYSGSTGPITADLDPAEAHPGTATGDGTDTLQNIENLIGSPANDTLSGDNAENLIMGGAGDDTIAGDAGDDCLFGNDGNDTFDENEGTSTAQGGSGTTNGEDEIFGNAGLDDTVDYSSRTTRVVVYLENFSFGAPGDVEDGADLDGDGSADDDEDDEIFLDVENAIGGSGNDILVASFLNNRADNEFTGNGGNDLMDGGAGNDIFHEGTAANGGDDMDGGTGSDTCDYSGRTNAVSVNLDGADNDGEAGEGDNCGGVVNANPPGTEEGDPVAGQDVENVNGGSGNDNLVGSNEANVLNGNAGNDTLSGLGGTDVLSGGDGDDALNGGGGNDSIDGGAGTDSADFGSATNGVVVNLATGTASGDGNDTLTGNENASGSSFQDSLRGDSGNNVLNGRGGNDAIQGLAGDDTINGGAGADEIGGGSGNDSLRGGNGQDTIRGGGGDDNLQGGPAADTLYGGTGDDVLSGGAGKDVHRGGPGTDRCNPGAPGLANGDRASGCES